ncbi:MAG: glycoside hydrolase family 15 protein [Aeromicrobium sp.]
MSNVPLREHALLSDCSTAALVTTAGSVDWLCLPRFDSPSVFARLLDDDAGHFLIAPASSELACRRRYLLPGLVVETTWAGDEGEVVLLDALALGRRERNHDLGHSAPGVLLRRIRCTRGSVAVRVEYAPRPEFGLVHPHLIKSSGGITSRGGPSILMLNTDASMDLSGATAAATVTLSRGQDLTFALQQSEPWTKQPKAWKPRHVRRRLKSTERTWSSWSRQHQTYDGPLEELVRHSGVVLQGLTYVRSGAIVAAPTTSLPEGVGSGRTWDYRYTWLRDASLTMQGLFVAACPQEAGRYFSFLSRAAGTQLERGVDLQIMFGIGGERDLSERELDHLAGWRNSGPVRVGNGAWTQRQLDVYGAILDAAYTMRAQLTDMSEEARTFLVAAVEAAATRWGDTDQGIWEVRGEPKHFVHSKLMCWVALERGIAMAELLGSADRVDQWAQQRDKLRDAILADGWNSKVGAFTQYFGSGALDASVLQMAIVGFLPSDDDRLISTINAIEVGLDDGNGLLYRYVGGDGIDEPEGSFLLCTFWLAHALAVIGEVERSRAVLERCAALASPLGLFPEQVDGRTGELLGNYPQAFSHLGLVNAAQALQDAERKAP